MNKPPTQFGSGRIVTIASMIFAVLNCVTPIATAQEKQWFVDQDLVLEQGSALGEQYLQENAKAFCSDHLNSILPWVVRIEVRHTFKQNGFSSNHGSGVILNGGLVLTAQHVLEQNVMEEPIEVLVTLADGRVFPVTVERKGDKRDKYWDWALLQLQESADLPAEDKSRPSSTQPSGFKLKDSPIKPTAAINEETIVFAAYPARQGLDQHGKIQTFQKGDEQDLIPVSQLNPSLIVSTVQDVDAIFLRPVAGFPPIGGMSGGPLFNLDGELVGLQISVSKTQDTTGRILSYRINGVPISAVDLEIAEADADETKEEQEPVLPLNKH